MKNLIWRQAVATVALLSVHSLLFYLAVGVSGIGKGPFYDANVLAGFVLAGAGTTTLSVLLLKLLGWTLDTLFVILYPLFGITVMGNLMIAALVFGLYDPTVLVFWFSFAGTVITIGLWHMYFALRPGRVLAKAPIYYAFTVQYIIAGLFILVEPRIYYVWQALHLFLFHHVSHKVIF